MPTTILRLLKRAVGRERAVEIYKKVHENNDYLSTDPEIARLMEENPDVHVLLSERDRIVSEARRLFHTGEFGIARHSTFKGLLEARTLLQRKKESNTFLRRFLSIDDMTLVLLGYEISYLETKCQEPVVIQEDRDRLRALQQRRDHPRVRERARRVYNIVASRFLEEHIIPEMNLKEEELNAGGTGPEEVKSEVSAIFESYVQYNASVVWVNSFMTDAMVESQVSSRLFQAPQNEVRVYCRPHNWERVVRICRDLAGQHSGVHVEEVVDNGKEAGGHLRITVPS